MHDLLVNIKIALGIAIATAFAGISQVLELLPHSLGQYISLLGMFSTVVLLWIQIRRDKREQQMFEATMQDIRKYKKNDQKGDK